MKKVLSLLTFISIVSIGFYISRGSIQDRLGYTEMAWNMSYLNFRKYILSPAVTPLNFILVALIQRLTHVAMNNAWKILDLTFGSLSAVFLINIFWKHQQTKSLLEKLIPILLVIGSLMFWYPYTSSTGEGATIFFALIGVYLWSKFRFLQAAPFFILSFLAKHDFYLIAPGLIIWTLLQLKNLNKQKKVWLFIAGLLITATLICYHIIKNGGEFREQAVYSSSLFGFVLSYLAQTGAQFLLGLFIGAPIAVIFFLSFPKPANLFWLCGLSALSVLISRFYQWHYPTHIIAYMLLYMFTLPKITESLKFRYVILQLILSLSVMKLLPVEAGLQTLIFKHPTIAESIQIENEIRKDYHGGKIGFYMNLRLDTPFPSYEISHLRPEWDFVIKDTEYIITPISFIPQQVLVFKQCQYTFYSQVGTNMIYKVNCKKN